MIPGEEKPIVPDPYPWALVHLPTEFIHLRFRSEWAAMMRAETLNRRYGDCYFTVDNAPREPLFRFLHKSGNFTEQPGTDVPTALTRMQRHAEEFAFVEQLPYDVPKAVKS